MCLANKLDVKYSCNLLDFDSARAVYKNSLKKICFGLKFTVERALK
jgi:hypothetical protein